MALNKLHKKDFSIAIKTGGNQFDDTKFAKEASKGELFFNTFDKKLYIATTDAGGSDATLYNTDAFTLTPIPFINGYSLQFDGVDDHTTASSTVSLTSGWSISFWIHPLSTARQYAASAAGTNWIQFDSTGQVWFRGGGGEKSVSTWSANIWSHYVITLDGSNNLLTYKNGSLSSTQTYSSASGWSFTDFGRSVSYSGYLNGYLDEFAVFNTVLTASEVSNIWNGEDAGGSGGAASTAGDLSTFDSGNGPLHWWRMGDNGTGTTIADQGPAPGIDMTLQNFPANPYSTSVLP